MIGQSGVICNYKQDEWWPRKAFIQIPCCVLRQNDSPVLLMQEGPSGMGILRNIKVEQGGAAVFYHAFHWRSERIFLLHGLFLLFSLILSTIF